MVHQDTYELVPGQNLSNITTRVLVQLFVVAKDDNRDVDGAQNGELMCLLEQAAFALEERSARRG